MMRPELESNRLSLKHPVVDAEEAQAERDLRRKLPKLTKNFYSAHYQHIGNRPGTFVGFACQVCGRWAEAGHTDACAVRYLERKRKKTHD